MSTQNDQVATLFADTTLSSDERSRRIVDACDGMKFLEFDRGFGFNDMEDSLTYLMENDSSLKTLKVGLTDDKNIVAIAKGLENNSTLTTLDLSWGGGGEKATAALSDMLKKNRTLKYMRMDWCYVFDQGAISLARGLKNNASLLTMDVSESEIGTPGADALMEAMKTNTTVTSLHFFHDGKFSTDELDRYRKTLNAHLERNQKLDLRESRVKEASLYVEKNRRS